VTEPDDFTRYFFRMMMVRIGLVVLAMACSYAGGAIGATTDSDQGEFFGALAGLVVGVTAAMLLYRRFRQSDR
jgi:hypothetical protein